MFGLLRLIREKVADAIVLGGYDGGVRLGLIDDSKVKDGEELEAMQQAIADRPKARKGS